MFQDQLLLDLAVQACVVCCALDHHGPPPEGHLPGAARLPGPDDRALQPGRRNMSSSTSVFVNSLVNTLPHTHTRADSHTQTISAELSCVLGLQESQAVPLSNISSVLAEATSGKNARRLHFQDEVQGGAAESTADTGNVPSRTATLTSLSSSKASNPSTGNDAQRCSQSECSSVFKRCGETDD